MVIADIRGDFRHLVGTRTLCALHSPPRDGDDDVHHMARNGAGRRILVLEVVMVRALLNSDEHEIDTTGSGQRGNDTDVAGDCQSVRHASLCFRRAATAHPGGKASRPSSRFGRNPLLIESKCLAWHL